ncbi:lamin tail domain-containing protein [Actinoplanes sp. OR16]|uniref:lamin tail domain-containing protein n=1 Tax=Actinoplanes sp. OR16 TaxID=946334 RepID=UPI000FDBAB6F|nr:lamin tail domain-containing protein [Actinoplanes sp. OR16]
MMLLTAAALTAVVAPLGVVQGDPAAVTTPVPRLDVAQYDSPGKDTRSAESLNAEWISLVNDGAKPVSITGWSIREQGGRAYTFGVATIAAKGRIWLHTGRGADTATHRYWNSGNYLWNNPGDTATLRDTTGKITDTCEWTQKTGRTQVTC